MTYRYFNKQTGPNKTSPCIYSQDINFISDYHFELKTTWGVSKDVNYTVTFNKGCSFQFI